MATPVAAGAAALVRQYLEEGFHTCGARSDEGGGMRNPSAALVKAMLISSARLPTSNFTRYHANTDHGTCQAHQVEGGGFPNTGAGRDSYCKLVHGDQAACSDLSRLLRDEDGESIYCSTPGADGCEHTLHCCTCSPVSALASRIRREGGCSPRRRSKWNWFTSTAVPNPGIHVHQSKHRSSGRFDAVAVAMRCALSSLNLTEIRIARAGSMGQRPAQQNDMAVRLATCGADYGVECLETYFGYDYDDSSRRRLLEHPVEAAGYHMQVGARRKKRRANLTLP